MHSFVVNEKTELSNAYSKKIRRYRVSSKLIFQNIFIVFLSAIEIDGSAICWKINVYPLYFGYLVSGVSVLFTKLVRLCK